MRARVILSLLLALTVLLAACGDDEKAKPVRIYGCDTARAGQITDACGRQNLQGGIDLRPAERFDSFPPMWLGVESKGLALTGAESPVRQLTQTPNGVRASIDFQYGDACPDATEEGCYVPLSVSNMKGIATEGVGCPAERILGVPALTRDEGDDGGEVALYTRDTTIAVLSGTSLAQARRAARRLRRINPPGPVVDLQPPRRDPTERCRTRLK